MYKRWNKQRPRYTQVINHLRANGNLGLFPASIDSAVLDVDRGNPDKVADAFKPYARYPSRRAGRQHLWYQAKAPMQLYLWEFGDAGGEILYDTRFAALPNPEQNLMALYQGMVSIPSDGLYLPDIPLLSSSPHTPLISDSDCHSLSDNSHIEVCDFCSHTGIGDAQTDKGATNPDRQNGHLAVDSAEVGERNISLFQDLRYWAYKQPRPKDFKVLEWLVMERALELREHLPSLWDYPEREARDTAKSVAKFCWENPQTAGSVDSDRQRKRAYLRAKRARQKAHNRDNEIIAWRDSHGKSWREIAALVGMSKSGVTDAYSRKKQEIKEKGND